VRPRASHSQSLHRGETVLHAVFGDSSVCQFGKGQQRAHGKIDAGGEDQEGHADGQKSDDDVEEID
jgi:hypothetical protein